LTLTPEGRLLIQLDQGMYCKNAKFTASNDKVVFISNMDGTVDIYTIKIDGTQLERLTNNAKSESYPVFSMDGSTIFFHQEGSIYSMNSKGANIKNLT